MKFVSSLFMLVISTSALLAQLPEKPEDVSPLLVGETIPDEQVATLDGKSVMFHKLIKAKPTVLVFYRGGWCPYCNLHLAELGEAEEEILQLGYQIIAVSPDDAAHLQATGEKNKVKYQLVSDVKGNLASATGIAFQAPERSKQRLSEYSDGQNPGYLPVPSLFVLNTQGEILFEYINPNYKVRIPADLLLAVLKTLETK